MLCNYSSLLSDVPGCYQKSKKCPLTFKKKLHTLECLHVGLLSKKLTVDKRCTADNKTKQIQNTQTLWVSEWVGYKPTTFYIVGEAAIAYHKREK